MDHSGVRGTALVIAGFAVCVFIRFLTAEGFPWWVAVGLGCGFLLPAIGLYQVASSLQRQDQRIQELEKRLTVREWSRCGRGAGPS